MFRAARDRITAETLKSQINRRFSRYGTIRRFEIDSERKAIVAGVVFRGETEEIFLRFDRYEVSVANGKTWLLLRSCFCDRVWMQHAIEDHVCARPIEIPKAAGILL